MATRAKKAGQRERLRRRTWGTRMALWGMLLAGAVAAIALVLINNGDRGPDRAPSSRFPSIHQFKTADYHSLALSPTEPVAVLFGHHNGVQRSDDGGDTWTTVIEESGRDAMNLVYDSVLPEVVYMAGHDVFALSNDGGRTWNDMASDLPGLDLHAFAASFAQENRLYAFAVGQGLYRSDNGGSEWTLVTSEAPQGTNSIVELPDGTLLLGATDRGILRSEDGGKTWSQSRTGIDVGVIFAIKGDPNGSWLYAGTDHGLYASADGGKTWTQTALDDTWIISIGADPSDPNTVLAIDRSGGLYRSTDAGATWG